jgi:hypothetical protein
VLGKNFSKGSLSSVVMNVVSVMAAYLPMMRVCTAQSREALMCSAHKHHGQICCHNTDYVHVNGRERTVTAILAKHCIELADDGVPFYSIHVGAISNIYNSCNYIYELYICASVG